MLFQPVKANIKKDDSIEKYRNPAGILLHSRTAVEKENFVSTGVITYAVGDIFEIEIPEYQLFKLGDSAKITVYSPGGIYTFQSTVIAKDEGALIFLNPPHNQSHLAEKREYPRVDVNQSGLLRAVSTQEANVQQLLETKMGLTILNISISGLGFTLEENQELEIGSTCLVDMKLGMGLNFICRAEIVRKEMLGDLFYYGARYIELGADKLNSLRGFVLKQQVELHFHRKKSEQVKRTFR